MPESVKDKTGRVMEKTGEKYNAAKEKAKEGYAATKEATGKVMERAGEHVSAVKASGRQLAKSAADDIKDTTGRRLAELRAIAAAKFPKYFKDDGKADDARRKRNEVQDSFRDVLASNGEIMELTRGGSHLATHTVPFRAKAGQTISWEFHLWEKDVGFKVLLRTMEDGGSAETEVVAFSKVEGSNRGCYTTDRDGMIVLVWDNSYSWMRGKAVAYKAEVTKDDEPAQGGAGGAAAAEEEEEEDAAEDAAAAGGGGGEVKEDDVAVAAVGDEEAEAMALLDEIIATPLESEKEEPKTPGAKLRKGSGRPSATPPRDRKSDM